MNKMIPKWLKLADDNLKVINDILLGPECASNPVTFHARQASGKLLKVLLIPDGIAPPSYVHDLKKLISYIHNDHVMKPVLARRVKFDNLHITSRYPSEDDTWQPPGRSTAEKWYAELMALRDQIKGYLLRA